jgi:hypothetical protein
MEDARFFHKQANWCYQLAWQCFDLPIAHKLNVMGNELKARELRSQERKGRDVLAGGHGHRWLSNFGRNDSTVARGRSAVKREADLDQGRWLSGLPFAPDPMPVRSTHNINGAIEIRIAHGDFVLPAAGWAFDQQPRLPRRA